jgi:N-acetylneuraminate synthase
MTKGKIDFKKINSTFLIAEIGINHNGSIDFVKKMIDYAIVFGWDCVKLQKRNPDISVPEHQRNILRDTPWGEMTYLEYKHKMEFNKEQYYEIEKYCSDKIKFTVSAWDEESVNFIDDFDVPFLKVPSAHLTNDNLLKYICNKKTPILLSTGMSTIDEVDHAVEIIQTFTNNFALMHTNSSYPAHEEELNLNVIKTFQDRYKCVVGYGGHEFGLITTAVAVALGAKIIERHVTINRTMWGTDQMASVEPQGMLKLSRQIRAIEMALGDGKKIVYKSELPIRKKLRGN